MVLNRTKQLKEVFLTFQMQLSPIKKRTHQQPFNMLFKFFTYRCVKQLTIFECSVVAASDFKNCMMVNCGYVTVQNEWPWIKDHRSA